VGLAWTRDTGRERLFTTHFVSGGFLGGSENLLRSSAEYSRSFPDQFFARGNAWAFRGSLFAVGSYRGNLPLHARLFLGDNLVRGFRSGELGPYASVNSRSNTPAETLGAIPTGANLAAAGNVEYRFSLTPRTEAVGFFDLGSGWLLPNWLGPVRPALLAATNGVLRGSTGLEIGWTVPSVDLPLRSSYAVNLLRLKRPLFLPDGSRLHPRERRSAFGWGLGSLF
jgi:outer membrane protein assembly factor BamA